MLIKTVISYLSIGCIDANRLRAMGRPRFGVALVAMRIAGGRMGASHLFGIWYFGPEFWRCDGKIYIHIWHFRERVLIAR